MHAEGVGAPTRWWFWSNAAVREFVGLLTEHKGKQALIALSLVAVYALLTFYAYA
jgi:erythromycin esterase-like protein